MNQPVEFALADDVRQSVSSSLEHWQQGFIAAGMTIYWGFDPKLRITSESVEVGEADDLEPVVRVEYDYVAIVTQTCDLVRDCARDPLVQVVPVVDLAGHSLLSEAQGGHSTRYAALPAIGDTFFADLSLCGSFEKALLVGREPVDGCGSDAARASFASTIARNRSRFAFPDGMDKVLEPLRRRLRKKHASTTSAEGKRIGELLEIRVRNDAGWEHQGPFHVTLRFIVDSEFLPDGADESQCSTSIREFLAADPDVTKVADALEESTLGSGDRYQLWQRLAELWHAKLGTHERVIVDEVEVVSAASYTLAEAYRERRLELDHLSSIAEPSDREN